MTVDLPAEIIGLDDYTESINMAIYADPGLGKTIIGASSEKPLIIATEQGTIAAARQGLLDAKMWKATSHIDQVWAAYEWIYDHCEDEQFPFDWVVIDTATKAQELGRKAIVERRVEEGVAKNLNPYKVELQEFGETQEMFKDLVNKFNDLPVNVLWLAHAKQVEDEEGNEFVCPDIHGKGYQLSTWFGAQMHALGYLRMDEVNVKGKDGNVRTVERRRIHWNAGHNFRAKDRFDCLGPHTTVGDTKKGARPLAELTKLIYDSASVPDDTSK